MAIKNVLICAVGSGCIGISIALNSNICEMLLIDISNDTLDNTKKNITLNGAEKKCKCMQSNLFSNVKDFLADIIVSNPPYIKTKDIDMLDEYVKKEPHIALDGGEDGLKYYKNILDNARHYLKDKGYIVFEIGYDQKEDLIKLIDGYKFYEYINCVKDLNNKDRVIICRFHQI